MKTRMNIEDELPKNAMVLRYSRPVFKRLQGQLSSEVQLLVAGPGRGQSQLVPLPPRIVRYFQISNLHQTDVF